MRLPDDGCYNCRPPTKEEHPLTEFDSIKEGEINRAILVGLNARRQSVGEIVTEASMAELEALLETAGGTCLATMIQNRETLHRRGQGAGVEGTGGRTGRRSGHLR